MAPKLSLVVITKNEQDSIARCLNSIPFADEIVVVDSGSSDRTVAICQQLGARVIATGDWPGFGPQKNRALSAATGEWVLSLDADEWIEPPLQEAIRTVIADPSAADGYMIPRRSRFCGEIVRYSWGRDHVLRLFRRDCGRFSDDIVHERVVVEGRIAYLSLPMEHDTIKNRADADDKIDRYSDAAALALTKKGRRATRFRALAQSLFAFIKTFVLRGGFLDGRTGWRVADYNRRYTYQKWLKASRMAERA